MKKYSAISLGIAFLFAFGLVGCATKPPVSAAKSQGKVEKQRIVVTKVPVLVKETSFYSDGLVDQYVVYKLDDAKKVVVEKDSYDTSRTDPIERVVIELKDGREAAETTYDADGKLRGRREFSYDSAGRLSSERLLDAQGKVLSASAYAYDAAGRKIEWRALNGAGGVKAITSYAYGKDGLGSVEMRDSGGAVTGSIKLEYANGKLAKRSYFGADAKTLQKYENYVYKGAFLTSLETHRADGAFLAKTVYDQGNNGELIKATEYSASGSVSGFTVYEYLVREESSTETYFE